MQVRHCMTTSGKLRVFFEHWHDGSKDNPGTMIVQDLISGITTSNLESSGYFLNQILPEDIHELGECASSSTELDANCTAIPGSKSRNNWAYFDFNVTCNEPVHVQFLEGNTVVLEDAYKEASAYCPEGPLFPVDIQGTFTDTTPPKITLNNVECVDGTVISASTNSHTDSSVPVDFLYGAEDCDPNPEYYSSMQSGADFPVGETKVTITATDSENNSAQCEFIVKVDRPVPNSQGGGGKRSSIQKVSCRNNIFWVCHSLA